MKIWKLTSEVDRFENLIPVKEFTAEEIQAFDGRKLKESWKPLPVKRMEPKKHLELSDYPGFTIPVLSEKALEILRPYLFSSVEELELLFQEKNYYAINVTAVLNVIDYDKSVFRTYSDGKRIMFFEKYAFKENADLAQHHIFKIVDEPRRYPFVSDEFKDAVEKNGLTGFHFQLVWDSDDPLVDDQEAEKTDTGEWQGQEESDSDVTYVEDLDAEVMEEIERTIGFAMKVFKIRDKNDGRKLAKKVFDAVNKILRNGKIPKEYDDLDDVACALGCLFGQALVSGYGWMWKAVGTSSEDATYCVVSPDERWVNPSMVYLNRILQGENLGLDGKDDNTVLLLYNMIEDRMKKPSITKHNFLW